MCLLTYFSHIYRMTKVYDFRWFVLAGFRGAGFVLYPVLCRVVVKINAVRWADL